MIKLLYFARLRETLGLSGESLTLPDCVADVRSLRAWLAARGGEWQAQFAGGSLLRAAVNQELAPDDAAIKSGDEVAFFPPMTGG